jgi:CHASE2 domain
VILLAAAGIAVEHLLDREHVLLHTRYEIYNFQTEILYKAKAASLNTYFIAIDDDAFWKGELARRLPLKRDYIAKLVEAVGNANPRAIVLDIDFRSPTPDGSAVSFTDYEQETGKLLQALKTVAADHPVVLPRSVDLDAKGQLQEQSDIFDHFSFGDAARHVFRGYIQLPDDLRTIPLCLPLPTAHLDSFALAMLHATYPETYTEIAHPKSDGCDPTRGVNLQFGRFLSVAKFEDRVLSAATVLTNDSGAREKISGNVVIVCGTWHQHSYQTGPPLDVHDSPPGEIPGAFVHANYYEALIQGHYFDSLSDILIDVIEVILILGSAVIIFYTKSIGWRLFAAFMPALVMIVFSYIFLQNMGAFFESFIPVVVLLCHMLLDHVLEWRERAMKYSEPIPATK